jgi:hypothetical protein
MLENANESQSVIVSVRLYRWLLSAYPKGFWQEYGPLMAQVFRDCCRRAYHHGGALALLALWVRTALDYIKTIVEEYVRGGTNMTREKFIKLSGWALLLGSIATVIGWLADSRPEYNQYNFASLPIDRYANMAATPLLVIGALLISLGMLGLLVRYGSQAGGFGRLTLVLGILGGLVSAVGMAGLSVNDSNPWWSMFFFGMTFQYLMLVLFGIVCLRRQILPRWNSLPLLAGLWIPGYVLVSGYLELFTGAWVDTPIAVFFTLWLITLVGFAGLGYLLLSDAQPAAPATGAA